MTATMAASAGSAVRSTTAAVADGGLAPAWVAEVPAMFRSAAQSIEVHRFRLVGDSSALRQLSGQWRDASGKCDQSWSSLDTVRRRVAASWQGSAAGVCDDRVEKLGGEVSASATYLTFAAEGLLLAAAALDRARGAADKAVMAYVVDVREMHAAVEALPTPARTQAQPTMIAKAVELGQQTLQAVYAQEVALDAVLASTWRRFVIGPAAPWRAGLPLVTDERTGVSVMAAVTLGVSRTTRLEGVSQTALQDGRVMIAFNDTYASGLYGRAGNKLSVNKLSLVPRETIQRLFAEVEAAPVGGYEQRYLFPDQAAADAFLRRLEGDTPLERLGSMARNAAGFIAGPLADFGPGREHVVEQTPHERSFRGGVTVEGHADTGLWPAAGISGNAAYDNGTTLTVRRDGTSSLSTDAGGKVTGGASTLGLTGASGGGDYTITSVDFNPQGDPMAYTLQRIKDVDFNYHSGTHDSPVGMDGSARQVPGGAYAKYDDVTFRRTITSHHLDLSPDNPDNLAAFNKALTDDAGVPVAVPAPSGTLADRLHHHGVTVQEEYVVHPQAGEVSATGVGGGLKVGSMNELTTLIDGRYVDRSRADGLYGSEPTPRPIPRDPR